MLVLEEEQGPPTPGAIERTLLDHASQQWVRLSHAAAEPMQERDWRGGGGVAGCGDVVAAGGGGGDVHEAVVVGGSVQVGDVLSGDDEGDLRMHGWTSFRVVRAL
jgi:hypothetical protein